MKKDIKDMKNLPNIITIIRILLIPFVIFFYLANFFDNGIGKLIAMILFIIASVTDMVDGYIARKYKLVSDFGIFLDPIADKIMASTGLVLLIVDSTLPNPYGVLLFILMLLRDYVVTGLRQLGQIKGCIIAADIWAKLKSIILDIGLVIGMLLAYFYEISTTTDFITTLEVIFYVFCGASAILLIISGTNYVVKNAHVFKDESKTNIKIEKDDSEDVIL